MTELDPDIAKAMKILENVNFKVSSFNLALKISNGKDFVVKIV